MNHAGLSVYPLDGGSDLPYVSGVPNAPKTGGQPQTTGAATAAIPFEEALKKLEEIVESMESQELPLEKLLSQYEEGTRLTRVCQEKLSEAELKIQQLEKTTAGDFKLKPLQIAEDQEG